MCNLPIESANRNRDKLSVFKWNNLIVASKYPKTDGNTELFQSRVLPSCYIIFPISIKNTFNHHSKKRLILYGEIIGVL